MACIIFPIVLIIALAIAAFVLRAACHLAGETVPGLGHAMGIVLITGIVQAIIGSVINIGFGVPVFQDPTQQQVDPGAALAAGVVGFLVNTPITMLLYSVMIPTSNFGKAALVWLIQLLIYIVIAVILFVLIFVLAMVLGGF